MGRYMTVELKEQYRNEIFIQSLNKELSTQYGANTGTKFNSWDSISEEIEYLNKNPDEILKLPCWLHPLTAQKLSGNFFWLRFGTFSFKLSGECNCDDARNAVAVSKWIEYTNAEFIKPYSSENYTPNIVKDYLNHLFEEAGYDLSELWKQPNQS